MHDVRRWRRYAIEVGAAFAIYGAVVASADVLRDGGQPRGLLVGLALLPALPVALMIMAFARQIRRLDELQSRIELDALAAAFGATILVTVAYGFLDKWAGFPKVSIVWTGPVMMATWTVARLVAHLRYR